MSVCQWRETHIYPIDCISGGRYTNLLPIEKFSVFIVIFSLSGQQFVCSTLKMPLPFTKIGKKKCKKYRPVRQSGKQSFPLLKNSFHLSPYLSLILSIHTFHLVSSNRRLLQPSKDTLGTPLNLLNIVKKEKYDCQWIYPYLLQYLKAPYIHFLFSALNLAFISFHSSTAFQCYAGNVSISSRN